MFNCNINLFMNKKIITGFLMFALAVFSMSSFVACKDIDEDSYDDLKARINGLKKEQMDLKTAIEGQIAQLKKALEDIKSCNCDPSKFVTKDELAKYATKEDLADYATKDDLANYVLKEDYDKKVSEIEERLKKLEEQVPSGKDYDKEIEELQKKQLEMLNELNSLIEKVEKLAELVGKNSEAIAELNEWKLGWDDKLNDMWDKVGTLWAWYLAGGSGGGCSEDCKAKMAEIEHLADSALNLSERALLLAQSACARIDNLEDYVSRLGNSVTYLDNRIDNLEDNVDDLDDRVDDLEGTVGLMAISIANLEDAVSDLIDKDEELQDEIDALKERLDSLLDRMVTGIIIQGTETPIIGYFNTPLDVRSQILAAYYGKVEHVVDFPNYYSSADYVDAEEFWTERNMAVIGTPDLAIDHIGAEDNGVFVTKNNNETTGNAGTLYLTVNPNNVDFTGKELSLVTSQGNEAGVTLEPLQASERELTFGYTRTAAANGFYEAAATLDIEGIKTAKVRVDYSNLKSTAKEMLKSKTKSSVLNFGAALLQSMKDVMPAYAVKASWSEKNKNQKYDVLSQYGIAATAVKPFSFAFLKDLNVNLPGEQKIINMLDELIDKININIDLNLPDFSKYQGAITFKDIELPTIDDDLLRIHYTKTYTAEDLAGEGKLWEDSDETQLFFLVTNKEGSKYALVSYDDYGNIQLWIRDGGVWRLATDDEFASFGAIEFELTVDVDINKTPELKSLLQDIIDDLNANFGANSDLAKTITDLLNDVSSLGDIDDKINDAIDDAKEDIKAQLADYVTRIYNKLNDIFSKTPNKALQPILIAKDGSKVQTLARSRKQATKVKSTTLTLIPTSYTMELFAPAYKKYIVVSNVWDKSGHWADASIGRAANGKNMGVIIDNATQTVKMNGKKGYTYEISYNAVDYQGKIVNKKFYVRF